jgi:hypothetical protein
MKKIQLFIYLIIAGSNLWAQSPEQMRLKSFKIDSLKFKPNNFEIGYNLLEIKKDLDFYSIQIKKHRNYFQKPGAWRLTIGFRTNYMDSTMSNDYSLSENYLEYFAYRKIPLLYANVINSQFDLGYQFEKHNANWRFFYGLDMHFAFSKSKNKIYVTDTYHPYTGDTLMLYIIYRYTDFETGIIGFWGMDYLLCKNLSISLESNVINNFYYNTVYINDQKEEQEESKYGDFYQKRYYRTELVPFAKLTLNYQF